MNVIWQDIVQFYKTHNTPVRFKYLNRLSMFEKKSSKYPKLRGKAAEIKYLAEPLLHVWKNITAHSWGFTETSAYI